MALKCDLSSGRAKVPFAEEVATRGEEEKTKVPTGEQGAIALPQGGQALASSA